MSILKVNTIQDKGGNTLLSSDGAGTISSGGAITNTPAFFATATGTQSLTTNTITKVQFANEVYDTNDAYDNSTNYRFTVPSGYAGKYFIYSSLNSFAGAVSNLDNFWIYIYKNGSQVFQRWNGFANNYVYLSSISASHSMDLLEGDYIEIYTQVTDTSGNPELFSNFQNFGAYRIIGA